MHVFHTTYAVWQGDDDDDDKVTGLPDEEIRWVKGRIILEHIVSYYPDPDNPLLIVIESNYGIKWTARDNIDRLDRAFRQAFFPHANRN